MEPGKIDASNRPDVRIQRKSSLPLFLSCFLPLELQRLDAYSDFLRDYSCLFLLTYFYLVLNTKINRDYVQRGYISEISDYLEIDRFLWCFRLIFVFKKL